MTFKEKCDLIDKTRAECPMFDEAFKDFLAYGNSFNGAYNHFTEKDIEFYMEENRKREEIQAWATKHGSSRPVSPVRLKDHSIVSELEAIKNDISKPSGNKRLSSNKDS